MIGLLGGCIGNAVIRRVRHHRMSHASQDAMVDLILDSVDAAITVFDRGGKLVRANKTAERLSGYSMAELQVPDTMRKVIPPEDYGAVSGFLDRPKLADFPRSNVNHWVSKNGERRLMKWSNVALNDGAGGVLLVVCIGFDITEQRQFERDLIEARNRAQEANIAKSMFLANMSHELRTPLNAIIGFSEIIRGRLLDASPEKTAEYAGDIHDSAILLLDLINDILDMSKLEAQKAVLEPQNIDTVALTTGCIKLVRQRAQEAGIKVIQRIDANLPLLFADERMVKQVLLNLLSNAIKFTGRNGTIVVSISRPASGDAKKNGIQISVSDSGIGIPESELANLFLPFHQAASSRREKPQGTGLGLAISKRLIELHEGTIAIASVEGRGTAVTIVMPPERCVEWENSGSMPLAMIEQRHTGTF
jgi:two-component system cell cycle sensor histidine kinase PleC